METAEVIVAGGGIIGLSTALELPRHGFRVRALEKGRAMSEASWATAGMLPPDNPAHPPELAKLADLSIRLYPEYLSTVEGLWGRSVRLRTQAAISTDEEEGSSVAAGAVTGLATPRWWKAGPGSGRAPAMGCPSSGAPDSRVVGWRRDTFVTGFCWRRPPG